MGVNDVLKFGGGLYWLEYIDGEIIDSEDGRDYKVGVDLNVKEKNIIIEDILKNVEFEYRDELKKYLFESKIKYIMEYGRVVYVEMEVIFVCVWSNISIYDGILYCIIFLCYNCVKYIVVSGIKRVVYIEFYFKSKVFDFYLDLILILDKNYISECVIFELFVGVGLCCFFNLFLISLGIGYKIKRKDNDGKVVEWDRRFGKFRM